MSIKVSPKTFKIYYQNVRGLRTKSHNFLSHVTTADYDLICLTESWLNSSFYDREYFDERYVVYRCDRSEKDSGAERGGGVIVAAKRSLLSLRRDWPCPPPAHAECLWVSIPLNNVNNRLHRSFLNIACVYIPHGSHHKDTVESFFDMASQCIVDCPNDTFLITGDFNVSHAEWMETNRGDLFLKPNTNHLIQCLSAFLAISNLKQFNNILNLHNRILDLILCSTNCLVAKCDHPLTLEDAHHKALWLELKLSYSASTTTSGNAVYRIHSSDFVGLNNDLESIDWHYFFSDLTMEECVSKFYNQLYKVIDKYVPCNLFRSSNSTPLWHSKVLRRLLKEKRKYHKLWKLYANPLDYESFKILRKRADKVEIECYNEFINYSENKIKSHPKLFWKFVKSVSSNKGIPQTMHYRNITTSDGVGICNLFSEHFQSVFEKSDQPSLIVSNLTPPSDTVFDISSIEVNQKIVLKYLKSVNVNKGAGPDKIHPLLIANCATTLVTPITILFSKSIAEGHVPEIWKKAWITPIPKGHVSHNIENYRPISKLCQFGKILEKIVTDQLGKVVSRHINPNQHGFYKGRSVESNLMLFSEVVRDAMDSNFQVDVVYTDFAKAFDKISFNTLLLKLWSLGVHGDLFRWIKSYVENRSQAVVLGGHSSNYREAYSGVPQGSHLGPLLFILYINDITTVLNNSNALLYADDTKIFRVVKGVSDCELLQSDLINFVRYCDNNSLLLNTNKCSVITFTRKKNPLLMHISCAVAACPEYKKYATWGLLWTPSSLLILI